MAIFEAVRILLMFALAFVTALIVTPFVVKLLNKFDAKKEYKERGKRTGFLRLT